VNCGANIINYELQITNYELKKPCGGHNLIFQIVSYLPIVKNTQYSKFPFLADFSKMGGHRF